MVSIPGGEFVMEAIAAIPMKRRRTKFALARFLIDKFEVTHDLFTKAQLPNPSHWQDGPKARSSGFVA